ncbi:hypothetical protein Sru01_61840 [Sphaerisporangium rufum]|uniref:Uncharacterized protein n=1 Tax=Sphaerisporangium rufum TaxID=1381558 RepID=A0A919RC03_9ACTN|nr:hypothetical protein [Sphaerisporangium rufum]GII81202.1 hypothetical protein Sru01_61840 [Sphaerisporangium rufum]
MQMEFGCAAGGEQAYGHRRHRPALITDMRGALKISAAPPAGRRSPMCRGHGSPHATATGDTVDLCLDKIPYLPCVRDTHAFY